MNRVMLSGRVSREAEVYQKEGGAAHAHSELEVEHRTAGGEWKKERYSLQGWHEMAERMKEALKLGRQAEISGYLTRNPRGEIEVVVEGVTVLEPRRPLFLRKQEAVQPAQADHEALDKALETVAV